MVTRALAPTKDHSKQYNGAI